MFIRECYQPLHDAILKYIKRSQCHGVVLLGTPGIGKSVFGVLEICRLICEKRTVYYQCHANWMLQLCQNGINVIKKSMEEYIEQARPNDWYIVDGLTPLDIPTDASVLLITSPKKEVWYNYRKQNGAKCLYMPYWSLNELRSCRDKVFPEVDDEKFSALYTKFGGVARFVLKEARDNSVSELMNILDDAIDEVDAKECLKISGEHSKRSTACHRIMHLAVSPDFLTAVLTPASPYVVQELTNSATKEDL